MPGEGGCGRHQDQMPLCRGREGVRSLPDSFWRPGSIQAGHSCISKWQAVVPLVPPEHPACVLDVCLRMTTRMPASVTSDSQLALGLFFATFLGPLVAQENKPPSINFKIQIETNSPGAAPGF